MDYLNPSLNDALNFLLNLYNQGLSYSTLNTARSALSTIIKIEGGNFGVNPIVTRFMKGVFETRLPSPKYKSIWDVSIVLKHLTESYPNVTLPLKDLTYKVLMLLLLVSSQRGQSIHLLDLKHMRMEDDRCSFDILQHTKTSRPGVSPTRIEIARYDPDTTICPLACFREYINRTKSFRGDETKLFLSYVKPYKAVSRDTISRWTKATLKLCGIDTSVFSAHSTRAASASKACARAVPIQDIMNQAGWSSAQTFYKYYNKPVIEEASVASAILS